jgi:hypothetical protein
MDESQKLADESQKLADPTFCSTVFGILVSEFLRLPYSIEIFSGSLFAIVRMIPRTLELYWAGQIGQSRELWDNSRSVLKTLGRRSQKLWNKGDFGGFQSQKLWNSVPKTSGSYNPTRKVGEGRWVLPTGWPCVHDRYGLITCWKLKAGGEWRGERGETRPLMTIGG